MNSQIISKRVYNTLTYSTNPSITTEMSKQEAGMHARGWTTKTIHWNERELTNMVRTESYSASVFKDGHKVKASVTEVYSIILDFDRGNPTLDDYIEKKVKLFRFSAFIHTTLNHQKQLLDQENHPKPVIDKFRVIIPLLRPLTQIEAELLKESDIIEKKFEIVPGSLDTSCKQSNRYYKHNPDAICYFHEYRDGNSTITFLDPDILLSIIKKKNCSNKNKFIPEDEVELKNHTQMRFNNIHFKTEVICPFCDPQNRQHPDQANAFVDLNDKGKRYLYCSSEDLTRWEEEDLSDNALELKCRNFFSYQTKVNEAAIVGDKFYLESIGKDKFYIRIESDNEETNKIYYSYLVKHKHIQGLNRIDYIGDIQLQESDYIADLINGKITVKIKGITEKISDNEFVENYLTTTFGQYKSFIKEWLAVYCYSNYQDLPTLILTGARGTGKNTFAEMVYEIFPTLSTIAKDINGNFNPNAESKLLIIDESDSSGKLQYQTLKSLSGAKYVEVNKKYVPQYQVWNNLNIIFLSNEDLPIYVERDEMPVDEANNQFFIYKMKALQTKIDPELDKKLNERIGQYIRTELKTVYENLDCSHFRYSIRVPITEEERRLFDNSISEEEVLADEIIDDLESKINISFWEYTPFLKDGFIPSEYFNEKLKSRLLMKSKVISKLRKYNYLTNDKADKHQADKKRLSCYKLGAAWHNRVQKVPALNSENRHFFDSTGTSKPLLE